MPPEPSDIPADARDPEFVRVVPPQSSPASSQTRRLLLVTLGAGLAAGLASGLVGERVYKTFKPGLRPILIMGTTRMLPTYHDDVIADTKNAALVFSAMGAALGLSLGAAGGLARGQLRAGVGAGLLGLGLGASVGGGLTLFVLPRYFRWYERDFLATDLVVPLIAHVAVWAPVGAAAGLAFGVGIGGRGKAARALLGGLAGGAIGTIVYDLIGAFAFPMDQTGQMIPETWWTRLLTHLAVAIFTAVGVALSFKNRRKAECSPVPTPRND